MRKLLEQFELTEEELSAIAMSSRDPKERIRVARFEAAQYWLAQGVQLVPIHLDFPWPVTPMQ